AGKAGRRRSAGLSHGTALQHTVVDPHVSLGHYSVSEVALGVRPAGLGAARMDRLGGRDHLVHRVAQRPRLGGDQLREGAAAGAEHGGAREKGFDRHQAEGLVPLRRVPQTARPGGRAWSRDRRIALGSSGVPGFRLRWTVWTNGIVAGPRLRGKWACRISPSDGMWGRRLAASPNLRGGTATTLASGTRVPGGASSVTRWPSAASPRTSATTTRWGPP